jgi:cobalt-zinc-cadmium efflux system membrane fusion protein
MTPSLMMAALLVLGLSGCTRNAQSAQQNKAAGDPLEITPDPTLKLAVKVGPVQTEAVNGTFRSAARVEADETRMARVSAPVTGRIVELHVIEGQMVKRGQTLATIYSTELAAAQSSLLKALSQRQLAERAVSRAEQLNKAGVIGEAELQRREAELQQASADLSSAREQLGVLGLSKAAIRNLERTRIVNSTTNIESSISGMVLERKATIGEMVQAAATVFVVADLSNVWMVADVPEQSAANIQVGKAVTAEIPALPDVKIAGTLSFVSPVVSPETRTVRVRMDLPNPERRFKPSMLATMTLVDGKERRQVIPSSAVVREGNDDTVFVQTKSNTYVLRRVTLGEEFSGYRTVENGLQPGEQVVVEGAFHLNNERKRRLLQGSEGD